MSIVTFYSYKGGVGRSLAVANVAVNLASMGKKVLVIDWDLEAPGLEEYFEDFVFNTDGRGLLFLLRDRDTLDNHIWHLTSTIGKVTLDILPSGRDEPTYYPTLERFNQDDFFADGGGDFLEELRAEWQERYDFVLIDSRTGLSDAGGTCTIQLPDIIIGMFTATRQSVRGVRDVLELARLSRQNLAYTRPQFSIVPVPCRLNSTDEGDLDRWMNEFAQAMEGITSDWRPKMISVRDVLYALRVEHSQALVHGTKIIDKTITGAPLQALEAYHRIAMLICNDLRDLSPLKIGHEDPEGRYLSRMSRPDQDFSDDLLGIGPSDEHEVQAMRAGWNDPFPSPSNAHSEYDIYYSVGSGSIESRWVEEFFHEPFIHHLEMQLGHPPRIFFDRKELSAGNNWTDQIRVAVETSRVMLAFITARSFRSEWSLAELRHFTMLRSDRALIPIRLSGSRLPNELNDFLAADFQEFFVTGSAEHYRDSSFWPPFDYAVRTLAQDVAKYLSDPARDIPTPTFRTSDTQG